jgi:hypothetical protein
MRLYKNPFAISTFITIIIIVLVAFTRIPLGIKGDWIWERLDILNISVYDVVMCSAIIFFGIAIAFIIDFKLPKEMFKTKLFGVFVICIIGLIFDYNVLLSGRIRIAENVIAVADKWTTGYLTQASNIEDLQTFWRDYHNSIALDQENSNHTDVHPPGNTIFSYFVIKFVSHFSKSTESFIKNIFSKEDISNVKNVVNP